MVLDQLTACSTDDMRSVISQQTSTYHGIKNSPSESTLLDVAKSLVNIGDLKNNFITTKCIEQNLLQLNRESEEVKKSWNSSESSTSTEYSEIRSSSQSTNLPLHSHEIMDYSSFPLKVRIGT